MTDFKKLLMEIEYDGSSFSGFQSQPHKNTIQDLIEEKLQIFFHTDVRIPIVSCSRTDRLVRAKCNLILFSLPVNKVIFDLTQVCLSLSHLCKPFVSFLSAEVVDSDFKFKSQVVAKCYRYYILNRPTPPTFLRPLVYHYPYKLNIELLNLMAKKIVGTLDFKSFQGRYCSSQATTKTIYSANFYYENDILIFEIVGSGFLHNMVRIIVGTFLNLSTRSINPITELEKILMAKNRRVAGPTAPAHGLCLEGILLRSGKKYGYLPSVVEVITN